MHGVECRGVWAPNQQLLMVGDPDGRLVRIPECEGQFLWSQGSVDQRERAKGPDKAQSSARACAHPGSGTRLHSRADRGLAYAIYNA